MGRNDIKSRKVYQEGDRYMNTKKGILRIGTFLTILMFLLVPLLSSPVAAAFNHTDTCLTENTSTLPPTVNIVRFSPWIYSHQNPNRATFQCICNTMGRKLMLQN